MGSTMRDLLREDYLYLDYPPLLTKYQNQLQELLKALKENARTIQGLKDERILKYLKDIPISLFKKITIMEYPKKIEKGFHSLYYRIRADYGVDALKNISRVDFQLSILSLILNVPIMSFDKHISDALRRRLHVNAIWPQDIKNYEVNTPCILDSNILISFLLKQKQAYLFVYDMLQSSNIALIIPICSLNEIDRVIRKRTQRATNKKNLTLSRKKESLIEMFIRESYEDYVPNPKSHRRLGKKKKKRKLKRLY